jgi:pimeloyl-ACP methyl ester carboxylesterase
MEENGPDATRRKPGSATGRRRERDPGVETGTVRTNDVDTYYVRRGEGPPVVFVHGMFMNARQWDPQLEALGDEYTAIAYDVRGHGFTGGSDRKSYSMELYASDLEALLAALDVERPVLCGLSMGGCIAQAYAARYPENVAGLVLSDTFATGQLSPTGRLVFANLRVFGLLDRFVRYTTLNRLQTWVGQRLSPGVAGDRATTQRVMEAGPTIPHAEFVKIARAMAEFPDSDFDLSQVTAPTLVTHGENLPAVFRDMHPKLAVQLANADVTVRAIPGAGHASNIDNPAVFSKTVREFLTRVERS